MTDARNVRDVAPGVRQVAVGRPFSSHAYLIAGPEGTIAFDTGVRGSGHEILAAADAMIAAALRRAASRSSETAVVM